MKDDVVLATWPCERTSRDKHTQKITQKDIELIKQYTSHLDIVVCVNVFDSALDSTKSSTLTELPRPGGFEVSDSIKKIKTLLNKANINYDKFVVDNSQHHLYHASAGFHTSGFNEALCIVIDGIGSGWAWESAMLSETTTIFYSSDKFETLYKHLHYKATHYRLTGWPDSIMANVKRLFNFPTEISPHLDIGKMYGTITRQIGFGSSTSAGKTMGLAAYGQPNDLPPMLLKDSLLSDINFFRNDSQVNTFLYPNLINPSDAIKKNLAYNVQKAAEAIFIKRVEQALKLRNTNNIVLGGGCALNILANSVIKKTFPHLNIFVEPIAADSSQALGAALFHYKRLFPNTKYQKLDHLYLGPEYSIVDTKAKLLKMVEQYNNESGLPVNSNPQ
jgi:carbamoyltransferase